MSGRLNIAQMAALYQISSRTLRYYEEAGILQSHRREDSKYREYDREQCQRLEIILMLRRLSFSVKTIAEILRGDEIHLRNSIQEKIAESGRVLLEARETDMLLRDLYAELSQKPLANINITNILSGYTYLTNKTERMVPVNTIEREKLEINACPALINSICGENEGDLVRRIGILRAELEMDGFVLPRVRIRDRENLKHAVIIKWDGAEFWRKEVMPADAAACVDEILAQLKLLCVS